MQTPEAFIVGYTPVPAAGRVAQAESLMRRALLSVVIYMVLAVVMWIFLREQLGLRAFLLGGVPAAVIVLGFVVWRFLALRSARSALGRVPAGEALRIDHRGVHVDGTADGSRTPATFAWSSISDIRAGGKRTGAGPDLVIEHPGGQWSVPLSWLDTLPGTIDSAVRAYSGGRRGLDLSGMDSIWGE